MIATLFQCERESTLVVVGKNFGKKSPIHRLFLYSKMATRAILTLTSRECGGECLTIPRYWDEKAIMAPTSALADTASSAILSSKYCLLGFQLWREEVRVFQLQGRQLLFAPFKLCFGLLTRLYITGLAPTRTIVIPSFVRYHLKQTLFREIPSETNTLSWDTISNKHSFVKYHLKQTFFREIPSETNTLSWDTIWNKHSSVRYHLKQTLFREIPSETNTLS